jgi:hypothetical protein
MLILNGHSSYLTSSFITYYFKNKILLIIYLPYTTYTLQLLDIVMFWSLSSYYKEGLSTRV